MAEAFKFARVPTLRSPQAFRDHCASLGIEIPCDDEIQTALDSPLAQPFSSFSINGKHPGNRITVQPMEGWDGTSTGGITPETLRRWTRFGESGAKIIFGGEAMAVRPDGRANPRQLILSPENESDIAKLRSSLIAAHAAKFGTADDLLIGFQLTHSGRFCRPNDKARLEPRTAFRHPYLDQKFGITNDSAVMTDDEVETLIRDYINAAAIARRIGADFVDIKHCHGYLLHEFLGAFTRPGKFGGSFENRTRILSEIVQRIRASENDIEIAVRLSAFDLIPFRPDPVTSQPGKLGKGIPIDFSSLLPYQYAFGINQDNPTEYDLSEPIQFLQLCASLGIKLVNLTAGSPYYIPHIQRPAAYPPSDGYQPPHDPLIDVARQIKVARHLRQSAPPSLLIIGSGYSYLQDFLPHVAQALIRQNWVDSIGLGRAILSYPEMLSDCLKGDSVEKKRICRTFSDCTTAPRNGLISGCYPLDKFYSEKPEFEELKRLKKEI
jgi:2,4-dienoyl-CoA reductase-like NADH-dependent reductase (Old Yellow Enzyme family)